MKEIKKDTIEIRAVGDNSTITRILVIKRRMRSYKSIITFNRDMDGKLRIGIVVGSCYYSR